MPENIYCLKKDGVMREEKRVGNIGHSCIRSLFMVYSSLIVQLQITTSSEIDNPSMISKTNVALPEDV